MPVVSSPYKTPPPVAPLRGGVFISPAHGRVYGPAGSERGGAREIPAGYYSDAAFGESPYGRTLAYTSNWGDVQSFLPWDGYFYATTIIARAVSTATGSGELYVSPNGDWGYTVTLTTSGGLMRVTLATNESGTNQSIVTATDIAPMAANVISVIRDGTRVCVIVNGEIRASRSDTGGSAFYGGTPTLNYRLACTTSSAHRILAVLGWSRRGRIPPIDELLAMRSPREVYARAFPRRDIPLQTGAGGAAIALEPSSVDITLGSTAPAIEQPRTMQPAACALALVGPGPTIGQSRDLQPGASAVLLGSLAPTIGQPRQLQSAAAGVALTGHAPTIAQSQSLQPAAAQVILSGAAPGVSQPQTVQPAVAAATLTGHAPSITQSLALQPGTAQIVAIGQAPSVGQPRVLQVAPAALVAAGLAPTIGQQLALQPAGAQIIVSGLVPQVTQPMTVQPEAAGCTVAGLAPTIARSQALQPDASQIIAAGLAPIIGQPKTVQPSASILAMSGHAPSVSQITPGLELLPGRRVVDLPSSGALSRTVYVYTQ